MDELINVFFGDYSWVQIFGYAWFFIIGYLLYSLVETTGRDIYSKNTPKNWNWKFWFYDNWKRYLTTILSTYILFRFYNEVSGHEFGYFDAVSLGLIGDGIGATLKKRTKSIAADRKKLLEELSKNDDL